MGVRIERDFEKEMKIEQFFEDYYGIREWDRKINSMMGGFLAAIHVLLMIFPFQELRQEGFDTVEVVLVNVLIITGVLSSYLYILPLISFGENQQRRRFYDKLKYFPIDVATLRRVKIRYLFRFEKKVFLAAMAVQLMFSAIICRGIKWENIAYIFIITGVIPVAINIFIICYEK